MITKEQADKGYMLAALLDVIPPKQYDHSSYTVDCGTKGCALGHAVAFGIVTSVKIDMGAFVRCKTRGTGILNGKDVAKDEFGFSDIFYNGYWDRKYSRQPSAFDMAEEIRSRLKQAGYQEPEEKPVFNARSGRLIVQEQKK